MDRSDFLSAISDEPLIFSGPTSSAVSHDGIARGGSLYFGTGLTTAKQMSVGVPFDVLAMLLLGEKIRRIAGLESIVQLIADVHALSNPFVAGADVARMTEQFALVMTAASEAINVSGFELVLGSSIENSLLYQEIYQAVRTDDHEYVRREWADIEYLRQARRLEVKLSWLIEPNAKRVGFDERLYDQRFTEVLGSQMSFVYTGPGLTLDANRLKVSPYISVLGEERILLSPTENALKKLRDAERRLTPKLYRRVTEHLTNICRLYGELSGQGKGILALPVEQQVDAVLDQIFSR